MTFRQVPPHYPREGGPEAAAKPDVVLQFGLAEVVRSRTVLGGALDLPRATGPTNSESHLSCQPSEARPLRLHTPR
jgi:hypothetical protein